MIKFFLILSLFVTFSLSYKDFNRRDVTFETKLLKEEAKKLHDEILDKRIISGRLGGGSVAEDTDFPFVADILSVWGTGPTTVCTGSIIASNIVLTARVCMFSDSLSASPTEAFVQVGLATRGPARFGTFANNAVWLDRWGMPAGPHPNFAIINTRDFFSMGPTVNVIRLPSFSQSTSTFDNMPMDIAGWGPSTGTTLHWGRVTVLPFASRTQIAGIFDYELACVQGASPSFETGDDGGPVILREGALNTLVGTLWQQRSSPAGNSITFMQIGQFWDFIHDETGIPRRWG